MQKTGELQRRWDSFRSQDVSFTMVSYNSCNATVMQLLLFCCLVRHACLLLSGAPHSHQRSLSFVCLLCGGLLHTACMHSTNLKPGA